MSSCFPSCLHQSTRSPTDDQLQDHLHCSTGRPDASRLALHGMCIAANAAPSCKCRFNLAYRDTQPFHKASPCATFSRQHILAQQAARKAFNTFAPNMQCWERVGSRELMLHCSSMQAQFVIGWCMPNHTWPLDGAHL